MKIFPALLCLLGVSVAQADPRADLQHAFDGILATGGFRGHAQGRVFGAGLPAMEGDVDVLFPDRIHVRTDDIEFIALSDRAWINTFGLWTQTDRSLLPITAFDTAAMRQAIASISNVRLEGTAKVGNCNAHVYYFHSSGRLPGASGEGDLRAWICDGSGRPARLEATDTRTAEKLVFAFDWTRRPAVNAPR
ncbi:MAG TPA: hypothetical protein VGH81_13030 [Rudaea sp.]